MADLYSVELIIWVWLGRNVHSRQKLKLTGGPARIWGVHQVDDAGL